MEKTKASRLEALDRMISRLKSLESYLSCARRAVNCSDPEVTQILLEACAYRIEDIYEAIRGEYGYLELKFDLFD